MREKKPASATPERRFLEFRSRPEWRLTKLSAVLKRHGLKSDGTSEVHSVSLAKGIVNQLEHLGRSYAANDTTHYSLVRPLDVVYTRSPLALFTLGIVKQHKEPENAIVSPLYGVFEPNNEHVGQLVEAFFDSPARAYQFLDPLAQKGAKNTIQLTDKRFLSGALYLPEDEGEQQKIADCLGSLDALIEAEGRKLDALEQHKRGLLQQLFPQPGETVPRRRFPEFVDGPEWKLRKLGPLTTKVGSGITPRGGAANYRDSGRPFVRSQNVGWGILLLEDIAHIDEETHSTFTSTELEVADVLLNITGASIGRAAMVDQQVVGGNVNQHVCIIRTIREQLVPRLLMQYLISWPGQKQINLLQAGGNRQGLNFGQIRSFEILLPPTITEQEKISNFLCAVDDQVVAQLRKLDTLAEHKRGLLQQLFPSSEGL